MTIATIENEVNYAALAVRVPKDLPKLPNSDRLYGLNVAGFLAVVDGSWLERAGEIAVLFPAEAQISEGLAKFTNLHRDASLNQDTEESGYLEKNRRVRPMKLRGNVSKALLLPLEKVAAYVAQSTTLGKERLAAWEIEFLLSEGESFDTINGVELSRKYVVPVKQANLSPAQAKLAKAFKRVDEKIFPQHIETEQYLRNEGHVVDSDIVIVTQKLHGTSVRFGNVPVKVEHTFWERLARKVGIRVPDYEYDRIGGSRKVIKDPKSETQNHFYSKDVWSQAASDFGDTIPKGYIVYGELVGFVDGAPIQKGYTYEESPTFKPELYVYRVAHVNQDGVLHDLSWDQVKTFATSHGLKHTPELWRGPKAALVLDKFAEKNFYSEWVDGQAAYPDVPAQLSKGGTGKDEGIVLRVDKGGEVPYLLKYKNDSFYLFEADELDKGEENLEA